MKDWLINEFYTFVEILHRRKAILLLPCFGMILFLTEEKIFHFKTMS